MPTPKKPFICECGKPALKKVDGGETICRSCIEKGRKLGIIANRTCGFQNPPEPPGQTRDWEHYYGDNSPIIFPDSIARLERMLSQASTYVDSEIG